MRFTQLSRAALFECRRCRILAIPRLGGLGRRIDVPPHAKSSEAGDTVVAARAQRAPQRDPGRHCDDVMDVMGTDMHAREGVTLASTPPLPSIRRAQPSRALTWIPITSVTAITSAGRHGGGTRRRGQSPHRVRPNDDSGRGRHYGTPEQRP